MGHVFQLTAVQSSTGGAGDGEGDATGGFGDGDGVAGGGEGDAAGGIGDGDDGGGGLGLGELGGVTGTSGEQPGPPPLRTQSSHS